MFQSWAIRPQLHQMLQCSMNPWMRIRPTLQYLHHAFLRQPCACRTSYQLLYAISFMSAPAIPQGAKAQAVWNNLWDNLLHIQLIKIDVCLLHQTWIFSGVMPYHLLSWWLVRLPPPPKSAVHQEDVIHAISVNAMLTAFCDAWPNKTERQFVQMKDARVCICRCCLEHKTTNFLGKLPPWVLSAVEPKT